MMTNLFKGNPCDDDNDCDADQSCNDQKCKSKEKVMQQHHQIFINIQNFMTFTSSANLHHKHTQKIHHVLCSPHIYINSSNILHHVSHKLLLHIVVYICTTAETCCIM